MTWLKSIGAVLAGLLVVGVGSTATDFVLAVVIPTYDIVHGLTPALYGVAIVQRLLWGVLGGFVVAKLAPRAAIAHAITLGAIGTVLNVVGMIAMWHVGNHWYPLTLAITSIPVTWLGGALGAARPARV